ncbi:MAG: Hsp20 family protein [bacterium]|nr:Hsp20 family protein [bacterium]MDP3381295.1 Hsp20 family protein [bacterium]
MRNVILPENLDFDSIKASLENNLLIITIQKLKFSSHNIKIDRVEM